MHNLIAVFLVNQICKRFNVKHFGTLHNFRLFSYYYNFTLIWVFFLGGRNWIRYFLKGRIQIFLKGWIQIQSSGSEAMGIIYFPSVLRDWKVQKIEVITFKNTCFCHKNVALTNLLRLRGSPLPWLFILTSARNFWMNFTGISCVKF